MTKFDRVVVWAGGALFAASLATCAGTYLLSWSAARPAWMPEAIAIDAVLFSVFALHHSLFAREAVKHAIARVVPDRLLRSVYVWTASILLLAVLALWQPTGGNIYDVRGALAVPFVLAQIAGLAIIAMSVRAIDALELAGIRPARADGTLQLGGPYRFVRHPLYLGWLLAVFASPHLTGDRLVFAVITTIYLVLAVPWEERSLRRTFGDDYAQYSRHVRWRIVPYVY